MKFSKIQQKGILDTKSQLDAKLGKSILAWYTGSGKTLMFLELCKMYIAENPNFKIGISSHFFTDLREQNGIVAKKLFKNKIYILNPGSELDLNCNIVIFNPVLMASRIKSIDYKLDLLIIDESHDGLSDDAKSLHNIITQCKPQKTLFVTATPYKLVKKFPNIPVNFRDISKGVEDGRLNQISFILSKTEADIQDTEYYSNGELKRNSYIKAIRCLIKSKFKCIFEDHTLGNKVLIIVPSGSQKYIKHLTGYLKGESLVYIQGNDESVLNRFKNDPNKKYLIVIRKCGVGFNMSELTGIVDLSLTRNPDLIIQRVGRLARILRNTKVKKYYYVYDSLSDNKLAWLLNVVTERMRGNFIDDNKTIPVNVPISLIKMIQTGKIDISKYLVNIKMQYKTITFSDYRVSKEENMRRIEEYIKATKSRLNK